MASGVRESVALTTVHNRCVTVRGRITDAIHVQELDIIKEKEGE
jgi:hypothetical protein